MMRAAYKGVRVAIIILLGLNKSIPGGGVMIEKKLLLIMVGLVFTMVATTAEAIPAFARKYNTSCSSCHSAMPQLNSRGRSFKEAGYAFPELKGEISISDFLHFDKYFPISAVLVSRPYEKADSGDDEMRAIHEIEVLVAGRFYKNVSGLFELEAEGEDGFHVEMGNAKASYNHSKALNAQIAYSSLLTEDPYDTYSDHRRLGSHHNPFLDQTFGGADNDSKFRKPHQSVSLNGRPMDNLFYSVGYAGVGEDMVGVNPGTYYGRLAVDVTPDIMVGVLGLKGKCEANAGNCLVDRDFSRVGVDAQADIQNFRLMGAYLQAKDDNATATNKDKNDAWYLEGQYMFKENGRAKIVPMIRVDEYEQSDGADQFTELTANLGYYFTENIRGAVEYWDQLDVPAGVVEDNRFTLQINAAF